MINIFLCKWKGEFNKYNELVEIRRRLIEEINKALTAQDKHFILSVKEGQPQWELLGLPGVEQLPAVQWKLINISKMDKYKKATALNELKAKLFI